MTALVIDTDLPGLDISHRKSPDCPGYRHRLTRSGDLTEGAMTALAIDTDLPGPEISQKAP